MNQLTMNNGVKAYAVNGIENALYFNPLDADFAKRILDAIPKCQKIMENKQISKDDEAEVLFAKLREADKEIRAAIDEAFGQPVCEKIFTETRVTALADGFPLWLNLILAIVDEIDANISAVDKQSSEKLQYYTGKYMKKYGKKV